MAVNWQSIEIPFGGGINTKTNPRRLQPPELEDLQNLVFTDAPGYKARYGSAVFTTTDSGGSAISNCEQLATHGNQLLLFDNEILYSYDTVSTEWARMRSFLTKPTLTQEYIGGQTSEHYAPSTAEVSGVRVVAFNDADSADYDLTVEIYDTTTGARLAKTTLSDAFEARCVASSNALYVFYVDPTNNNIEYVKATVADPGTITSPTAAKSDAHADDQFNLTKDPTDSDGFIIGYKRENTGAELAAFTFDASSDTAGSTVTITSSSPDNDFDQIVMCANQSFVFFGGHETNTTGDVFIYRATLSLGSPAHVDSATTTGTSPERTAIATDTSASDNSPDHFMWQEGNSMWYTAGQTIATALAGPQVIYNCGIASNGFYDTTISQSMMWLVSYQGTTTLGTCFLLYSLDDRVEAQARFGAGIAYADDSYAPANVWLESSNDWVFPGIGNRRAVTSTDARVFSGKTCLLGKANFVTAGNYQSVEFGDTTFFVAGNTLWEYDGSQVCSNNFLVYPVGITTAQASAGGSLESGKQYNYRVYYEYRDNKGNIARSTTGKVVTVTLNSTNTETTLTIPTLNRSEHPFAGTEKAVSIAVYRSEGDANVAAGAPFYRCSSIDPSATGANGYIRNDINSETVSFNDELADSTLINRELDYLNTGELDNVAVPDVKYIAIAKSRLWAVSSLYPDICYFSKLKGSGDAVAFNETNQLVLPPDSDPDGITAIAELNHFVVFFKSESIYVVSGDGPDNLGRGFFNEPQRVTSDVGCSEPRSVVAYDGGILFKSDKGIYRLGQNLDVKYIGAPVEEYNSQDITAATLVNDQNQIRFLTSSGRMLVFDYLVGQWTTFTGWTGISAVNWRNGDVYCWAEADGTVHQEDSSTYGDNGTAVDWSFTTAPITLQGLGGFYRMQRVLFEGDYGTAVRFEVTPYYNGVSTGTEAAVTSASLTTNDPFRVVFNMPRQKFSDVKFKVVADKNANPPYTGVTIQSMRAKVAYKPGLDKLPDANKFGE